MKGPGGDARAFFSACAPEFVASRNEGVDSADNGGVAGGLPRGIPLPLFGYADEVIE
jgi:hypothetical protein